MQNFVVILHSGSYSDRREDVICLTHSEDRAHELCTKANAFIEEYTASCNKIHKEYISTLPKDKNGKPDTSYKRPNDCPHFAIKLSSTKFAEDVTVADLKVLFYPIEFTVWDMADSDFSYFEVPVLE